jgi:hypothetical protein
MTREGVGYLDRDIIGQNRWRWLDLDVGEEDALRRAAEGGDGEDGDVNGRSYEDEVLGGDGNPIRPVLSEGLRRNDSHKASPVRVAHAVLAT